MIEPITWITTVTALGGLLKSWIEMRKSGLEFEKIRAEFTQQPQALLDVTMKELQTTQTLIIDESLLVQLVTDINGAKERFVSTINDPRYTPADIDREENRAKLVICTHLNRIRKYNNGLLPTEKLESLSTSFCKP